MDQVRIDVILFYHLLGQRLNLIVNLVGCLFDCDIIFWSIKRFKCAELTTNETMSGEECLRFSSWKHRLKRLPSIW